MRVEMSPRAAEFVRGHGGRLFVWVDAHACCGGTRFIEASTDEPATRSEFVHVPNSDADVDIFVRPPGGGGALPDELQVDMGGLFHRRVGAFWNGCAFLV